MEVTVEVVATPGSMFGRYVIKGVLGKGGGGEVYLAWDTAEQDDVALKLLYPSAHPGGPWIEAAILRRLSDGHILPIRNADVLLGQHYMVTDVANHGTVQHRIDAAGSLGLGVDQAVHWLRQACHGVARGHDAGLVHNDIKPENIFLGSGNDAMVGDWGVAGLLDPTSRLAFAFGATAETVAPEVAAAWGTPTQAASRESDIYSLGATAYWMLAGVPPRSVPPGLSVPDAMRWASTAPLPRLHDVAPHLPARIVATVDRAMALLPQDRFATAPDLAAALGARPRVERRWARTDEHGVHLACWRGEKAGAATYVMCLQPGTTARNRVVTTTSVTSGRRVSAGCATATASTWPSVVRRLIRAMA